MTSFEELWEDLIEILPWTKMATEAWRQASLEHVLGLAAIQLFKDSEGDTPRANRIRWALNEQHPEEIPTE